MMESFQSPATPVIPDHQLIRRIDQGSYGEVWLAKNVIGTYRAVKIVYRVRFETERPYEREFIGIQKFEPISRSHPGLVDILQIGRNDACGYFYYVMELADDERAGNEFEPKYYSAKTLSKELAARGRLPALECLWLGQSLAAALAHMHHHGLVHRDIKPLNIIFVNGEPKLADIGTVALATTAGTYVGTEGFIPPEGQGTIRADIYSLGKVLYEISTGQDRQLFPNLPGDLSHFSDAELVVELNEVVVKACANSPSARYASAEDLRADLQLIAGGRSVRRLRFVERQLARVKRIAAAAIVLALAATIFGFIVTALRTRERRLVTHNYLTGATRLMEEGNLHGALPLLAEALRLQKRDSSTLDTHRTRIGSLLQQSPKLLQFWQMDHGVVDAHFSPDGEQLLLAGERHAWLVNIQTGTTGASFPAEHAIKTATFSPDAHRVLLAYERSISVRDVSTGATNFTIRLHDVVSTAEFSPDGTLILVSCDKNCGHLLNATDGSASGERLRGHTEPIIFAAFSPDGSLIVTAAQDGTARIWNARTREKIHVLRHAQWVQAAAFSPNGRRVVTASSDHTLRVWNVADGSVSVARMEHRSGVRRASFSPDGRYIISSGFDQTVRIWDAANGQPVGATLNLRSAAMQAEFDADGCRVVVAGFGGEVKVWNVMPAATVSAGMGVVTGNGERYVTYSSNGFQVWSARDGSPAGPARTAPADIVNVLCNATGDRVVAQTSDLENDSRLVHLFAGGAEPVNAFSAPGTGRRWLNDSGTKLITTSSREMYLWDVSAGTVICGPIKFPAGIHRAFFSPDESVIAVAVEKEVFLLDGGGSNLLAMPLRCEQNVHALGFAPDSRRLVTATKTPGGFAPGTAQVWNARTGERIGLAMAHGDGLSDVQFSHDGELVATVGEDNHARVWDAASGAPMGEPISLLWPVLSVAFSADDRWLVTATWFGVQVWDARTGHAVTPPFTDAAILKRAGFCAGDQRLWADSRRGLLFWDLPRHTGEPDDLIALADHLGVTVPASVQWNHNSFPVAKLRERCAAERLHLQTRLESWQQEQARLSETVRDWFAAQFFLGRLLQKNPNDVALRTRWSAAREKFETAIPPMPDFTAEPSR